MVSHDADAKGEQECRARVQKASDVQEKARFRPCFYPDVDFRTFREGRCASN